jgi:hypothetical protein
VHATGLRGKVTEHDALRAAGEWGGHLNCVSTKPPAVYQTAALSKHPDDRAAPVKLYLRRAYLDNGGYDRNGTYFGTGAPLYWCADADGNVDFMLRARDRADAKRQVVAKYPSATFWR